MCDGCSYNYFKVIAEFYEQESKSISFLRQHGVLPYKVFCKFCDSPCTFREDKRIWRCRKSTVIPKTKKRRYCNFSASDQKGTFLHNCYIPVWKILIFINHFLSHLWDHKTIQTCLGLSSRIIVDWRVFCAEVCAKWFDNQEAIGGENIEVEIDETQFVRRKYNRGRLLFF